MIADLHIHTTASDGRVSPREVLLQAQAAGLSHIAITDHDTVDGLLDIVPEKNGVIIIPGIELNTDLPGHEVHILGYCIDINNTRLQNELRKMTLDRVERAKKIVAKLGLLGFPIEYQRVLDIAGDSKAIGRPHIAKALLEKRYFSNMDEVFSTLLETNGPAYVPHYKLSPTDALELIDEAGGISVVAHPGLIRNDEIVLSMMHAGVQGLEVYHPKHSKEQTNKYLSMAEQFSLLITGGSDFHGIPGRFPERLGQFVIPSSLAMNLTPASRHEST
jgi:predicted metal-dependent phosphoesterase TrpH